jgi:site-specific recombinase XerD
MEREPLTFAAQMQEWLASSPDLSESARSAYRGEINRLAEFMADQGIRGARQMHESHWLEYLAAVVQDRDAIASRRRPALKVTSALQAARITRLFLRHCYLRRWISWVPLGPRKCKVERLPLHRALSPGAIELLLGPTPAGEQNARALAAISLAFWAAMKPREIAAARLCDLKLDEQQAELAVIGRPQPILLPTLALQHLWAYHDQRRRAVEESDEGWEGDQGGARVSRDEGASRRARGGDMPLISQLGTYAAVTPHRVWTLLKGWPPDSAGEQRQLTLGARTLRDWFTALASEAGVAELVVVRDHTGRIDLEALRQESAQDGASAELGRRVAEALRATMTAAAR